MRPHETTYHDGALVRPDCPPIVVEGLRYRYPPPRPGAQSVDALRGIDLLVDRGECLAIVGPVGAGKSTLCQALVGLVPHAWGGEFGGRVVVEGLDTRTHQPADVCRRVGIVFQDAASQLFNSTVEDEAAFGPEGLALPPAEVNRRVDRALDATGLAGCRERSPRELSGGQQQRLAIAAALALRPTTLVLDEPMASLDPRGVADLYAIIADLRSSTGLTVVVVEQDAERVAEHADRIVVLDAGQIVALDRPARVYAVAGLAAGVVTPPPIGALAARLREVEPDLPAFVTVDAAESVLRPRLGQAGDSQRATVDTGREIAVGESPARSSGALASGSLGARGLWHTYPNGLVALAGVDLDVPAGDRVAIVGQNGSGKTTLAKHFVGLLRPTRGQVLVDGRNAAGRGIGNLATSVGFVFQNPDHQIFAPTVWDELAYGPRQLGVPESEVRERVAESLAFFGLTDHAADPPAALGYGLRRIVGLAGVLTLRPRAIVLDEPFNGLDWRATSDTLDRLAALNERGHTIVVVTHDMRVVAEFARRVIVLAGGKIVADTTPRSLFARPDLLALAGLARPAVAELGVRLGLSGPSGICLSVDELAAAYFAARVERPGCDQLAVASEQEAAGGPLR